MKFKVNDKVKVIGNHNCYTNKKIKDQSFIGKIGTIVKSNFYDTYQYEVNFNYCDAYPYPFIESDLELVEKTLDDLEVGDQVVNENGIIEITKIEKMYFYKDASLGEDIKYGYPYSVSELKEYGYKLYQKPETVTINDKVYKVTPELTKVLEGLEEVNE